MKALKPILSGIFLSLLLFLTGACAQTDDIGNQAEFYTYQVPEQVNDGWETAHMADMGTDTEPILEMMNHLWLNSMAINLD